MGSTDYAPTGDRRAQHLRTALRACSGPREVTALICAFGHLIQNASSQIRTCLIIIHMVVALPLLVLAIPLLKEQQSATLKPTAASADPVQLIIDTDLGFDVDDVGAIAVAQRHRPSVSGGGVACRGPDFV